ncbi:hypothetical protein [Gordonia sp. OPL2]|uniref:hypothetical protein n=1 Tax=Gordonia sp. OPL2 TaxID=2486274 RepID=UPI00165572C4|nr:hypothetical protein [Gordonia sp. OPL2]ROZ88962.1 hypothetical protein EEB19_19805 [Gordonia sp. OPL2]
MRHRSESASGSVRGSRGGRTTVLLAGTLTVMMIVATLGPGNELVHFLSSDRRSSGIGEEPSVLPGALPDGGEEALDDLTSAMARLDAAIERAESEFSGESPWDDENPPRVTIWPVCATMPVAPRVAAAIE